MAKAKNQSLEGQRMKYYIHSLICIVIMFGFQFIPPFTDAITHTGMNALGIFLGVLYGWTFVSMIWPSLLGMVACGFTGLMTVQESFLQGFGADIVIITLFVFIFAAFMEQSGLNRWIANWFISRKVVIGRPYVFLAMMVISAWVLSTFTYIFAAIIVLWSVFYNISRELGFEKRAPFVNCVLFGIVLGGTLGAITMPFNPMDVIVLGMMQSSVGLTVNYVTFSIFNIFFGIIIVILYTLACKLLFRPDTGALSEKVDRFGYLRSEKMNSDQKTALGALLVFLAMLLLPGVLPKTWPVISQLATLSVSGSAIVVIIALMILRDKKSSENEGLLNWGKSAIKGVNWDVIILLASTMPISAALESDESGVLAACEQFLKSQIGDMSPLLAIAFISIALAIITQFSHNAVLLIIFVPMLCPLVASYGINPVVMAITLMFSVQSALLTPAASTQAAMIYSNTEWIDKKTIFKLALCAMIIMLVVALLGVLPAANIVY